ncbi:universal stress protein, partial [Mycobacterium kansasii]
LEEARRHSAAVLDEARNRLSGTVDVSAVGGLGDTVEDAVNGLDWHPGDLIMVGSSRLAAPRRLFLGSTAAKMLRVLDVPMVVVPRAGLA